MTNDYSYKEIACKPNPLIALYCNNDITNNNRIGENVKMNRKITMMFTVTTLLVLLLGVVNASEVSDDTELSVIHKILVYMIHPLWITQ